MEYLLSLTDSKREHMVVFTLREIDVKRSAADFFFDVVGSDADELGRDGVVAEGQIDDLKSLQQQLFDSDAQGAFIRDDAMIYVNGQELDPDGQMIAAFLPAERDGKKYMRCDASVSVAGAAPGAGKPAAYGAAGAPFNAAPFNAAPDDGDTDEEKLQNFARMMFIHQIATGYQLDVTKDFPELMDSIAEAERHEWIEIDVSKAAYKLTAEGKKMHDAWMAEAQDLIKRYDIYGDTDVASDGSVRFDTKLGRDLRIPMFEFDGVDPFRARYLIGLTDGDWDNIKDWEKDYKNEGWYETLMRDVENAASVEEIGEDTLRRVLEKGKEQLRMDSRFR